MTPVRFVVALGLALACAAQTQAIGQPRAQQGYSRAAQRVLAQARAASGGSAWGYLRGWHETGRWDGAPYETWLDPLRYGLRTEIHEPAGVSVHGFNGLGAWRIAPSGVVSGTGDPAAVVPARGEAFFAVNGFLFPGRFDARGDYLGRRRRQGRDFDVVSVKPWGGPARELWFDAATHLLARAVTPGRPRPVTEEVSDYRRVGPLRVAFRFTRDDGGAGGARVRQLERLDFAPADRGLFSLPRP